MTARPVGSGCTGSSTSSRRTSRWPGCAGCAGWRVRPTTTGWAGTGAARAKRWWKRRFWPIGSSTLWRRSRGRYGVPRVTAGLRKKGVEVNEKRVARLMGELGIAGRCGRRKVRTTWRDKRQQAAVDLVLRHFTAPGPDQTWVGDITYIPTGEGWLFVASVLDVHSRMMVGWSIADHLRTELCADALEAAVAARGRLRMSGTVFHTDHGCQYTSDDFQALCRQLGIRQSMGTVGDSYDNAMAESLWASLKRELVDDAYFATKEEARLAIFEWINWYNSVRLHSSLDYQSPWEYEQAWQEQQAA